MKAPIGELTCQLPHVQDISVLTSLPPIKGRAACASAAAVELRERDSPFPNGETNPEHISRHAQDYFESWAEPNRGALYKVIIFFAFCS